MESLHNKFFECKFKHKNKQKLLVQKVKTKD